MREWFMIALLLLMAPFVTAKTIIIEHQVDLNFTGQNISADYIIGDGSGLYNVNASSIEEDDPLWSANYSNGYNKTSWDAAYSWGDHGIEGYLIADNLTTSYYAPSSSVAVAGTIAGTIDLVNHTDASYDAKTINITESAGSPGLDVRINFTGIPAFNKGVMRYYTTALKGDYPVIQLWNYDTSDWEDYPTVGESLTFAIIDQTVYDDDEHLSDGIVQMRLYKAANGNTGNNYYIDWIAIANGIAVPSGQETDPFSIHRDGSTELTANWAAGSFNITADYFIGNILYQSLAAGWSNTTTYTFTPLITMIRQESLLGSSSPSLVVNVSRAGYFVRSENASNSGNFYFVKDRVGTPPVSNDGIGRFWFGAYNGSEYLARAYFGAVLSGSVDALNAPIDLLFSTTDTNTITERMRINASGFVGVGTSVPSSLFHIKITDDDNVITLEDSDGLCQGNPEAGEVSWTCSSDLSIKDNVHEVNKEVLINKLDTYASTIKEYDVKASGDHKIGTIAQDLQQVLPEMVVNRTILNSDGVLVCSNINDDVICNISNKNVFSETQLAVKTITNQELTLSDAYIREDIAALTLRVNELETKLANICKKDPVLCSGVEIG